MTYMPVMLFSFAQATGGSDGKVLFFNSDLFEPGQLNQPCAAVQNIPAEDGVACISWMPGEISGPA